MSEDLKVLHGNINSKKSLIKSSSHEQSVRISHVDRQTSSIFKFQFIQIMALEGRMGSQLGIYNFYMGIFRNIVKINYFKVFFSRLAGP